MVDERAARSNASRGAPSRAHSGAVRRLIRMAVFAGLLVVALFAALLLAWDVAPPVSTLMAARRLGGGSVARDWVPLGQVAPVLVASVTASEDGRYCQHHGVDWDALRGVIADAGEAGPSRGASTIAMQTAKNLFLWPSRSAVRKGLEIPIALLIDKVWGKKRVIEVYLNVAEWGDGLFGVEAAARRYFNKNAARLTPSEAALLAAALPNPRERDPSRPTIYLRRRAAVIARRAHAQVAFLDCLYER